LRGLPTLVTFADINDPLTVIHIDPESPGSIRDALGAGISLKKATIEFVEPDGWWQRLVDQTRRRPMSWNADCLGSFG
jgi:hypothetical protein